MKRSLSWQTASSALAVRRAGRVLLGALFVCALAWVPASAQKRQAASRAADAQTGAPAARGQAQAKTPLYYSCPMHPSVKEAKAGKCPKCGMELRPVYEETAAAAVEAPAATPAVAEESRPVARGARASIPDLEVLNQDGQKLHFYSDLVKDRVVAINFIFTTCTTICPPLGATFARVQKELGERVGRDVSLISVSVDPVTDTPERLKAWGAKFHAGPGWTFVTGDKTQIDQILKAFAAEVSRREDHSPTVVVLNDAKGVVTRTYGLARPSQLIQVINDAAAGKAAESSAKE